MTSFVVKVAGPVYDRTTGKWRLRLIGDGGEDLWTELNQTGRAINNHFGASVVVKGTLNVGKKGEKTLHIQRFDPPQTRRRVEPEECIDKDLEESWAAEEAVSEGDDLEGDDDVGQDVPEEED
jgi:hypothetical protein